MFEDNYNQQLATTCEFHPAFKLLKDIACNPK